MKLQIIIGILIGLLIGSGGMFLWQNHHKTPQSAETNGQLFSCGMHPQVISDKPGDCPICGMKLTPIRSTAVGNSKILYWQAPMDPTEIYDKPGKSKMGMDLVPVYENADSGQNGAITVDGTIQQNMNMQITPVVRLDLSRKIRAYGKVGFAEDKEYSVNTKMSGWIEKLYVDKTGENVQKGDPLLEIYSPELVSTQNEYLLALDNYKKLNKNGMNEAAKSAQVLLEASKNRLTNWDISQDEIKNLEDTHTVKQTLLLRAPASGVVTHKSIFAGDKVMPGMDLFHIAEIHTVWVNVSVYESDLPFIQKGQQVEIETDFVENGSITGYVDYIYPYLDTKSKSANVRLICVNKENRLLPDMFVTANIRTATRKNVIAIPSQAIIRTGKRNIVFVTTDNQSFSPREVSLGLENDEGMVEISKGLSDNERVVTSGQFLLDSESKTREAISKMRAIQTSKTGSNQSDDRMNMTDSSEHEHAMPEKNMENKKVPVKNAAQNTMNKINPDSLYACSMHPDFITTKADERCPECGMKLDPVKELGDQVDLKKAVFYTCPMHTYYKTTNKDGRCSECGMKLDKVSTNN